MSGSVDHIRSRCRQDAYRIQEASNIWEDVIVDEGFSGCSGNGENVFIDTFSLGRIELLKSLALLCGCIHRPIPIRAAARWFLIANWQFWSS